MKHKFNKTQIYPEISKIRVLKTQIRLSKTQIRVVISKTRICFSENLEICVLKTQIRLSKTQIRVYKHEFAFAGTLGVLFLRVWKKTDYLGFLGFVITLWGGQFEPFAGSLLSFDGCACVSSIWGRIRWFEFEEQRRSSPNAVSFLTENTKAKFVEFVVVVPELVPMFIRVRTC